MHWVELIVQYKLEMKTMQKEIYIMLIPKSSFDVHNFFNETLCMISRNIFVQYNCKKIVLLCFVVK